MFPVRVVAGDITNHPCDVLILKHADGFHGVDELVADMIGFQADVDAGDHAFVRGAGTKARKVLFLGVGALFEFRYEKIRNFARRSLAILAQGDNKAEILCSPIHGPGYGLDEREAFLSLVGGFFDAFEEGSAPKDLSRIDILEKSPQRAVRLNALLDDLTRSSWSSISGKAGLSKADEEVVHEQLVHFGAESEKKAKLFVAMPFADTYSDVWDVAIIEACAGAGVFCERIDAQSFVGDIVSEIKKRLTISSGIIAVLDGANANVFLELGFAWAMGKPSILVASSTEGLPFDVKGQRCLLYKGKIKDLWTMLEAELKSLIDQGILKHG